MSLPTSHNIFELYKAHTLIESGSYRGDAIRLAIDAGYKQVRSIDIMAEQVEFCKSRFRMKLNEHLVDGKCMVRLYHGDSAQMLSQLLIGVSDDCTIFLDAHTQWLEDEPEMPTPFPLPNELYQIAITGVKPKHIFIDDILFLTHGSITGWNLNQIKSWVWAINPNYQIELIANPVRENFLIAWL